MQFTGTDDYIADKDLMVAVNAAIRLERPLLVKGEPGTGKTELARQVAASLGLRLIEERAKGLERSVLAELLHAVAAHHDARAARTAEAAVLYHANQLDAVAATRSVDPEA